MNFQKFLTFSALICALLFLILALQYNESPLLQNLMRFTEGLAGIEAEDAFDWQRAFYLWAAALSLGTALLYFFAKNLSAIRYGGIFVLYLVLVMMLITALIL